MYYIEFLHVYSAALGTCSRVSLTARAHNITYCPPNIVRSHNSFTNFTLDNTQCARARGAAHVTWKTCAAGLRDWGCMHFDVPQPIDLDRTRGHISISRRLMHYNAHALRCCVWVEIAIQIRCLHELAWRIYWRELV